VRVTVDLADASSSSDPFKYDRVGSWKWLKLPPGTATKKRTRKQGKIGMFPVVEFNVSDTQRWNFETPSPRTFSIFPQL